MEATPYILNEFKAFTLNSSIDEIQEFFNETTYTHFPILKNKETKQLLGLIAKDDLIDLENTGKEIGNHRYLFNLFYASDTLSLVEIITIFSSNYSNVIPVINDKKEYLGYYDLLDILQLYNQTPFLSTEGAVLLIEKEIIDYSFSEICQIIESNGAKMLGVFVFEISPATAKIMVKFSTMDVNEIIQSFRRYNYNIITNHKEDVFLEELIDRTNYLQKYLNI